MDLGKGSFTSPQEKSGLVHKDGGDLRSPGLVFFGPLLGLFRAVLGLFRATQKYGGGLFPRRNKLIFPLVTFSLALVLSPVVAPALQSCKLQPSTTKYFYFLHRGWFLIGQHSLPGVPGDNTKLQSWNMQRMFPVTSLDSPLQAYLTLEALQMKILPQRTKLPYLRFPF